MTLVEKVADAMRTLVRESGHNATIGFEGLAVAALKAIRDAGDDILAPGDDALAEGLGIDAAWQAIFDAALSEIRSFP